MIAKRRLAVEARGNPLLASGRPGNPLFHTRESSMANVDEERHILVTGEMSEAAVAEVHRGDVEAERLIGNLKPGSLRVCVTNGHARLVQMVAAILAQTGPADLVISTWVVARRDIEALVELRKAGAFTRIRLLIDGGMIKRERVGYSQLVDTFWRENIREFRNHAKMALIGNDTWGGIAMPTSANLTGNPRQEHYTVIVDTRIWRSLMEEWVEPYFAEAQ